jgi:hypothetical protein
MIENTPSAQPEVLPTIVATLTDLSARVERIDARIGTVTTVPKEPDGAEDRIDEWIWEGNRARRVLGRPLNW